MSHADTMPRQIRAGTPLAFIGVSLLLVGAVAAMSAPEGLGAVMVVVFKVLTSGWPVPLYLLGAIGLGRMARPLFAGSMDAALAQTGVGLALMLGLSHLLGQLGLVHGVKGMVSAWAPIVVGLALLAQQLAGWSQRAQAASATPDSPDPFADPAFAPSRPWLIVDWLGFLTAAAILVVAACSPPGGPLGLGGLWRSEAGGFDALSYHLPIVQEWLANGSLKPLEHNIYSYLPSYVEAAFLQMGVLMGAGRATGGMLANDGAALLTCQMLHAGFGVVAAWGAFRLVRAWVPVGSQEASAARLAATLTLATPWAVVVGSLAYNELAVAALSAPLLLVAADRGLAPWRRGLFAGLILGAAASVKPPAFFLLGGPAGALLLCAIPLRRWPAMIVSGCLAGAAIMAPWLVRNWATCGNPVFPFASTLFGAAHWSAEQLARYSAAHHESAPWLQKLAMIVVKPEGADQHRGVFHQQWALFFPAVAIGAGLAIRDRPRRPLAITLAAGFTVSFVAWLVFTHIQSRFLLPLLIPGAALIALGAASLPPAAARVVAVVLGLAQAGVLAAIFSIQLGGSPGAGLVWMPADAAGESHRALLARADSGKRMDFFTKEATPTQYCNLGLPPASKVYLLGDATPLYFTVPVLYNTVWDRWPLLDAMDKFPGDATQQGGLWIQHLRTFGVTHVLVNLPEIHRYRQSGYSDPRLTVEAVLDTFLPRAARARVWGPPEAPQLILFNIASLPKGLALAAPRKAHP